MALGCALCAGETAGRLATFAKHFFVDDKGEAQVVLDVTVVAFQQIERREELRASVAHPSNRA